MKQILYIGIILGLFLPSQAILASDTTANDAKTKCLSFKERALINIPVINVPVRFEHIEDVAWYAKLQLAGTALQHIGLAYIQLKNPIKHYPTMIAQQAAFAGGRSLFGLTNTLCHELGHVAGYKMIPSSNVGGIELEWSPIEIMSGMYGGVTYAGWTLPSLQVSATEPTATKDDVLTYCQEAEKFYKQRATSFIAGPVAGITTLYPLSKGLQRMFPLLAKQKVCGLRFFTLFNAWMLLGNMHSLSTFEDYTDMSQALEELKKADQAKELKAFALQHPDGTIFKFPSQNQD